MSITHFVASPSISAGSGTTASMCEKEPESKVYWGGSLTQNLWIPSMSKKQYHFFFLLWRYESFKTTIFWSIAQVSTNGCNMVNWWRQGCQSCGDQLFLPWWMILCHLTKYIFYQFLLWAHLWGKWRQKRKKFLSPYLDSTWRLSCYCWCSLYLPLFLAPV